MPAIVIGALFILREDWEGYNGSGVTMEDDDDTDVEVGGYSYDFLEVDLPTFGGAFWEEEDDNEDNGVEQGQQAQRRRCDAVDVCYAL